MSTRRRSRRIARPGLGASLVFLLLPFAVSLVSCRSLYYQAWEQVGQHKRDILTSRVKASRQDQREAQEQFQTTFELFKEATGFQGGNIETFYNRLSKELERSEQRAEAVTQKIASIEQVARDLFREWKGEAAQISNPDLRRGSEQNLYRTQRRYESLITAMKRAEASMEPVLVAFRDQVLFLKHNLNAKAIASLEGTVVSIQGDVADLIHDMQASIAEAETFLAGMES